MVTVSVNGGICGLSTTIKLESKDSKQATLHMKSECKIIRNIGTELSKLDIYAECFAEIGTSPVYHFFRKHRSHAACPVPLAITKGSEVLGGLALPKDVLIAIARD